MSIKRLDILVYCIVFTAIGATGGWMASQQDKQSKSGDPETEAPAAAAGVMLSAQTLSNLGVKTGVIQPRDFVKYRAIPAQIERTAFNEQPVFAPIGGRILEVLARPGHAVKAGEILLTMVRDPIPRPTIGLTAGVIKPETEKIHQALVELRTAVAEIAILDTEKARIEKFTGGSAGSDLPILPRQKLIDLRYSLLRMQQRLEQSRHELAKHGFSEPEIAELAKGGVIPVLGKENWMRALVANGLWTDDAKNLYGSLPPGMQTERWIIATVSELAAAGLATDGLIQWIGSIGPKFTHFLEIGTLLQRGFSVEDLRLLYKLNALDAVVSVRAPMNMDGKIPDWNIEDLSVKVGAQVMRGDQLVTLLNPREMFLRAHSVGGEKADVLRAITARSVCDAHALAKGSGPQLKGFTIDFVRSDDDGHGMSAYATVANSVLASSDSAKTPYRSWQLREGLKYMIRVPATTLKKVYVIPSEAVAEDGPRKVVFIPDGKQFKQVEVEISYQDDEVAVIAINSRTELFPGDTMVMSGAYALGLALRSSPTAIDPHAGHSH